MAHARLRIDFRRVPDELRAGLAEIAADRPDEFCAAGCPGQSDVCTCIDLTFSHDPELAGSAMSERGPALAASVPQDGRAVHIAYGQRVAAFRALGRLLGQLSTPASPAGTPGVTPFRERSPFRMLGIMVDASRNGVLRVEAVKKLLRHVALMGINTCMLYTEDTYEVPGHPFFGYLRGRYTRAELEELDRYAFDLGIEMIPCIQALGHLEQVLQWPAYAAYRDTASVLMAEDEKAYELLEEMIAAASAPFRSKRIHLGMDEAFGIGTGRYRERHGERRAFDILNAHLTRVREICLRLGLSPMIWSDMYFRLGSKTHEYYDREATIPDDARRAIPEDVSLVYWDYYHVDSDFYAEWIERHRQLGSEPVMAGGVWTWDRMWASLPFSFTATEACMRACKEKGVREAFVTMWGDDGMECDVFSALPGIQFFAEHGYTETPQVDAQMLRSGFSGSCGPGALFDDWVKASELDAPPGVDDPSRSHANPSKWLLWQDPLLAIMDPLVEGLPLREHYEKLAQALFDAAGRAGDPWGGRLLLPACLAHALALKSELRRHLAAAYSRGDRAALRRLATVDVPALQAAVATLWKTHRRVWMSTYKPFGWEVIERRYGGLQARIATLADTLAAYLAGETASIPELEVRLERPMETSWGTLPGVRYARVATPSTIK